jgi:hypothetical protein
MQSGTTLRAAPLLPLRHPATHEDLWKAPENFPQILTRSSRKAQGYRDFFKDLAGLS